MSKKRNRLRVGVVGFGEIGRVHIQHLQQAGAKVTGVVTHHRESRPGFPFYDSLKSLLPDVDAVTIAVPNYLHAKFCLEAMRAGKAVLVEKPLCLTASELAELEATLLSTSVPVKLGFRLRWNPRLRALRERLDHVRSVDCCYRLGIDKLAAGKDWTRHQDKSGGALFTLGIHALDLIRWLVGAQGAPLSDMEVLADYGDDSSDFPLVVSLSGRLLNDIHITAEADLRGDTPFSLGLKIDAEKGCYPDPSLPWPGPEDEAATDCEYMGLIKDFVRASKHGKPNRDEVFEYLESHRELIKAQELISRKGYPVLK